MTYIFRPEENVDDFDKVYYPGFNFSKETQIKELHYREVCSLELSEGDLIKLTNSDGGSSVLLFAVGEEGEDAGSLLSTQTLPAVKLDEQVSISAEYLSFLASKHSHLQNICCRSVFDKATLAQENYLIRSQGKLTLWLAFPVPVDAIEQGGGGTVHIEHTRKNQTDEYPLPKPLGEIVQEFRVASGTAQAYQVKAGEYIQVIDIEGRQCSDFMAMSQAALKQGKERYIDSTVTRTMVGRAYPAPGLYDKFFDQDMQPLLAVVQDTVGRHDTFALACTARGYEERGFPGHLNCSDNISRAYEPYGIQPRQAWPAINFFFNSTIDPHTNHLSSNEAWSRPGDYVVMKALQDLVCVSTACPDDIDAINGWNPTDLQVRVYSKDSNIPKAIAHRPFTESEYNMTIESAFHPRTSALTQSFSVARDLWLPTHYEATSAIEEYWACSQRVTIQDMSSLRKYDIMGPDAETLLQLAMTRDVSKLSTNRGFYSLMCSETGTVIDDGTLFHMGPHLYRWCCGSEESGRQLKSIAEENNLKVWIKSLWSAMPNLAIQGPKSRELLAKLLFVQPTQPLLENVKWFGFTIGRLYDRNGPLFMLTRSGFTGELGYEIFCDKEAALPIWDAIMKEGEAFGITPMGGEALNIKRIEAGLMVAANEFPPTVDAFEAGLGFAVDLKKKHFVGREALVRHSEAPKVQLVGLHLEGSEVPHHGAPIFYGRNQVGVITSAVRSPELDKVIALARVAVEYKELGTALEVGCLDGHMKRQVASVCSIPFIDPKRERARA
ncbi:DUF1989 domain-containing protein [Marinomonas pollencensis]|uniref:Aminomethyltransferase n=1 Tax=Marinomonas pollencensis TaxID=491954 RepID=A0A3E0DGV4_9GAMM|nr:aminomethyltransferase family protein [Marinomonas pollencensis]REG81951.1 aminomethyltransferase [Marinomonas pollencensis]